MKFFVEITDVHGDSYFYSSNRSGTKEVDPAVNRIFTSIKEFNELIELQKMDGRTFTYKRYYILDDDFFEELDNI